MSRLNDHLTTMPKETQLIVRLGRALQAGEVRVRLSLLQMEKAEVKPVPGYSTLSFCHSWPPVLQATDGIHCDQRDDCERVQETVNS